MADNYYQCTPVQALKATREESVKLIELLQDDEESDRYNGFTGEYYDKDGQFYMYAEDSGDTDGFSEDFLAELGKLIAKNRMLYLEFGYAFTCSKMHPGDFGGGRFRIYVDGTLVYPRDTWPDTK